MLGVEKVQGRRIGERRRGEVEGLGRGEAQRKEDYQSSPSSWKKKKKLKKKREKREKKEPSLARSV